MSFKALLSRLQEPDLIAVAMHWNAARGRKLMPGWTDIDPSAISRQLPIVWAYRYFPETETFVGRLAGEAINAIHGRSIRGMALDDLFPTPDAAENVRARYLRVVKEPCMYRSTGQVFTKIGRSGTGERVILPLASDGVHADGVFGATFYRLAMPPLFAEGVSEAPFYMEPEYFPVSLP